MHPFFLFLSLFALLTLKVFAQSPTLLGTFLDASAPAVIHTKRSAESNKVGSLNQRLNIAGFKDPEFNFPIVPGGNDRNDTAPARPVILPINPDTPKWRNITVPLRPPTRNITVPLPSATRNRTVAKPIPTIPPREPDRENHGPGAEPRLPRPIIPPRRTRTVALPTSTSMFLDRTRTLALPGPTRTKTLSPIPTPPKVEKKETKTPDKPSILPLDPNRPEDSNSRDPLLPDPESDNDVFKDIDSDEDEEEDEDGQDEDEKKDERPEDEEEDEKKDNHRSGGEFTLPNPILPPTTKQSGSLLPATIWPSK